MEVTEKMESIMQPILLKHNHSVKAGVLKEFYKYTEKNFKCVICVL